jgi:DNA polymerase-3 subunit epsilon
MRADITRFTGGSCCRIVTAADKTPTRVGLFLDVETTGLDPQKDKVIELAVVPFTYSFDGRILEVPEAHQRFQEPSAPICEAITAMGWACLMMQVDWSGEGHQGVEPACLAADAGFYYDQH